jgi:hypothetical protein
MNVWLIFLWTKGDVMNCWNRCMCTRHGKAARGAMVSAWPCIVGALLTWAVLVPSSYAQVASATLSGNVTDETGAVVPETQIAIQSAATALRREARTDKDGSFIVTFLPPGHYVVTAERQGFARSEVRDVVLNVNDHVLIGIRLRIQGTTEDVTVSAEASRARVTPGVGTVVDRQFIANMPLNGRSLQSLLQLVPGVVLATASGSATGAAQFSVNGQRATSNSFMVDGVSANTGIGASQADFPGAAGSGQTAGTTALGTTSSLVSLDALQEFRIETSTFAPEFGRTPGGQISLITRGGSNAFHGSASEYFRHDAMDANDWFASSRGLPKARMRQQLFGGVLGGPVRSDRLFFFGSYEGLRLDQPRTSIVGVPILELRAQAPQELQPYLNALPVPNGKALSSGIAEFAASYSDHGSFDVSALRLDAQMSNRFTGFVRVSHAPSETTTRTNSFSTLSTTKAVNDSVTGGMTWIAMSRLTADFRLNWTRNKATLVQDLDSFGGAIVPAASAVFLPGRDPSNAVFRFNAISGSFAWGPGTADVQRQINAVGTVAAVAGSHQLKFGVDYRRNLPLLGGGGFASGENLFFPTAQSIANGQALVYLLNNSDTVAREAVVSSLSVYAQDAWQVARRLTLTYGLRFERVPPPSESNGRVPRTILGIETDVPDNPRLAPEGTPLWRTRASELAPRFGAAYQASTRPGWESTVRAGVGIFYDLGLGDIANAFQAIYPFYADRLMLFLPIPLPAAARVPPELGVGPPRQFRLLDPNLRQPYTRQWHAGWEQSVGPNQAVTATYVGAAGRLLLMQRYYSVPLAEWPTFNTQLYVQRNEGESTYHALQLQYRRRLHRGLQALASYTLARSRDNGSSDVATLPTGAQPALLNAQWGPSDFDVRHVTSIGVTYDVPAFSRRSLLTAVLRDWGVDLLLRAQSGFPLSPELDANVAGAGNLTQRPDVVPGQPFYLSDVAAPGGRRLNPAAFVAPGDESEQGTSPRNGLRAFGASQVDLAIRREFGGLRHVRLQVRAELFNLLNHPNFGPFKTTIDDPLFGQSTQMLNRSLGGLNALYQMGGARSAQLAVKALF